MTGAMAKLCRMIFALFMILAATSYRIAAAWEPSLVNFSPLLAIAFCGGVYFRNRWLWLVPLAALTLSDLYLNQYYFTTFGYEWTWAGAAIRAVCFAAAIVLGWTVSHRKNWITLLAGIFGSGVIFYLVTNTASWIADVSYAHTLAGWWQAMTVGHPQFPPTWLFFRNSFASDLLFTGLFVAVMEYSAYRRLRPSLIRTPGH